MQLPAFRICIFSSEWTPVHNLQHLLWRLSANLPEVEVAGILYEAAPPPLTFRKRIERAQKYMFDSDFILYFANNFSKRITEKLEKVQARLLHLAHGTVRSPNDGPATIEDFVGECEARGIAFKLTKEVHNEASLKFVADLKADIGVTFGARILKPKLFSIPRLGCINSHQHKLPEYRGSGPPGLWEIRDGKTEVTITVHRVTTEVDGGAVLDERSFPIQPHDTLTSLALKANLLGIDGLIHVIRTECYGKSAETPQLAEGTVYKGIPPHKMWAMEESIRKKQKLSFPLARSHFWKLATRMFAYPVLFFQNQRRAKEKNYPIILLAHYLISDRPKHNALPTEYFLRHVRFLKEHYRIASLPEAVGMLKKGEVDAPTVVLTFDYGYAENSLGLRAVIEAENIPVALFICTQHATERSEFQRDIERGEHGFPSLGWDEIRYFDRHGVCNRSQGRTYFECCSTDEGMLVGEILGSLEDLRRELGHDINYFSRSNDCQDKMSEVVRRIARRYYPYVFSTCGCVDYGSLSSDILLKHCKHPQSLWELELLLQSVS